MFVCMYLHVYKYTHKNIFTFTFTQTLQEWAIAEQKELEEKTKSTKPSTVDQNENIVTVDSKDFLTKLARHQEPLLIPVRYNYSLAVDL